MTKRIEELCDNCHTNKSEIRVSGIGSFCKDCFNERVLNVLNIKDTFKYPKTKTIKGYRFKLSHLILRDKVFFEAEGINSDYCFRMTYPVIKDGKYAVTKFLKKIEDGINTKTIGDDNTYLKDKGNILINDDCFIIDGKKITSNELLEMLSPYSGFNLTFQINDLTDELLKEDEYLIPSKINEQSLINKVLEIVNMYSKEGFIDSRDVYKVDLALFNVIDNLKYLYDHKDREEVFDCGIRILDLLSSINTDDDYFPINQIESICKIIDKYNDKNLFDKYREMYIHRNKQND